MKPINKHIINNLYTKIKILNNKEYSYNEKIEDRNAEYLIEKRIYISYKVIAY